jgi:hypothetical protein
MRLMASPGVPVGLEDLRAGRRQPVVAAPPLTGLLDPPALNPTALLEAVQQRVQRRHAKREQTAGARFDQLAQIVAVSGLILEQRQDQEFGAAFFQLAIETWRSHILCSDILAKGI